MGAIVLTICSDRKRLNPPEALCAHHLDGGSQEAVTRQWLNLVEIATPSAPAHEIYCGRAFREAEEASRLLKGTLWVISGGLGLIPSDQQIPSYRLTLAPGSDDSIGRKIEGERFSSPEWWRQVNSRHKTSFPIAELTRNNSRALVCVALSGPYAELVCQDLASLEDPDLTRVRFFGRKLAEIAPEAVRPYVMPYDERFDGPESPVPGTLSDSAQRAMRHFAQHIWPKAKDADVGHHRELVSRSLEGIDFPQRPDRTPKSDNEIIQIIQDCWEQSKGRSSWMLRHLRDEMQVACEQGRFRKLFQEARSQLESR